jgi:6-pyruvoyltetrahydropterin/6-carboxytetrahydropterin synthase
MDAPPSPQLLQTGDRLRLERRYRFSASHLYRRPEWSDEENSRRFGKCANIPGHGHNYRLWVSVEGALDPRTGFVADLADLDRVVGEAVLEPLDHQHLNTALPEFAAGGLIPSSENLLLWIRRVLLAALPAPVRLVRLRLEEDEDLAAEWRGE